MPFRDEKQKACTTINSGPGKTRNDFPHIKQNLNENWTPNSVLPLPSSLSTLFHFFFFFTSLSLILIPEDQLLWNGLDGSLSVLYVPLGVGPGFQVSWGRFLHG